MSGPHHDERLSRLWEEHMRAPFPAGFRGVDFDGIDLILLDADVAGLVQWELEDGLDDDGVAVLWTCITRLDTILPLIGEDYCTAYYARLRLMAGDVAARYTPSAI
ncbi:hypothetical protein ACH4ZX_28015 [Streptomyces sp. NPDC020490]|uniref:hypothetical protein n=1 Tax=Streptomyces sp. NPDC020490 TaxID=3365078 RepID=UPI003793BAB5